jgi:hypothetical protein
MGAISGVGTADGDILRKLRHSKLQIKTIKHIIILRVSFCCDIRYCNILTYYLGNILAYYLDNKMGAISGVGTAYLSGAHKFIPGF